MTAPGPLIFPGSRVLAGWWQQLAPVRPRSLWVGHLLLHGVEALVWVSRPRPLERFGQLVLQALTLGDRTIESAERHVHLGLPVLRRVLHRLRAEGLAHAAGGDWLPTALGRHALERGEYPALGQERRRFVFVQSSRAGPPQFLHLPAAVCVPRPAPEDWSFAPALLHECVRQPSEWKQRRGFPLEVEGVIGPADTTGRSSEPPSQDVPSPATAESVAAAHLPLPTPLPEPSEWQRVVLNRAEHLLVLLVAVEAEGPALLGYAVKAEGGGLRVEQPLFRLGAEGQEIFPEVAEEPPPDVWRQAWRAWCQQRQVPQAEACTLERCDHRLRVWADKRLVDRLRSSRNEALRGEAWLLAGSDRIRPAALLEVVEKGV